MPTLIRIQEGTPLIEKLDLMFKDYELEIFKETPNFLDSFKRRAAILCEALRFLLKAHPPTGRDYLLPFAKIDDYLKVHGINFEDKKTFAAQQEELERYVKSLVHLIAAVYGETLNPVDLLNDAECYLLLEKGRKNILTLTWYQEFGAYLVQEEEALPTCNAPLLEDLKILKKQLEERALIPKQWPLWFSVLAPHKQNCIFYLLNNVSSDEDIQNRFFFIPSRNRDLPALSNWARHRIRLINLKREVIFESDWKYRSSHIVPRDLFSETALSEEVRESILQRHISTNLQHVISTTTPSKLLIHTLISPVKLMKYFLPDYFLSQKLMEHVCLLQSKSIDLALLFLNQPQNLMKYFAYTQEDETTKEIERVGHALGEALMTEKKKEVEALLERFNAVLRSSFGSATFNDHHGRELTLTSYIGLILTRAGYVSYGSCVSGKDRKAVEIMHTDALELYNALFQRWPNFDNENDRKNFTDVFCQLYKTRHHAVHAGQNAPGAEGIKTPDRYLAADIAYKIGFCAEDDRIASNNEVHAICKKGDRDKTVSQTLCAQWMFSLCKELVQQLGEACCHAIDLQFKRLVARRELFPQALGLRLFGPMPFDDFVKIVGNCSKPLELRWAEIFNYGLKYYHLEVGNADINATQLELFKCMWQFLKSANGEKFLQDLEGLFPEAIQTTSYTC